MRTIYFQTISSIKLVVLKLGTEYMLTKKLKKCWCNSSEPTSYCISVLIKWTVNPKLVSSENLSELTTLGLTRPFVHY